MASHSLLYGKPPGSSYRPTSAKEKALFLAEADKRMQQEANELVSRVKTARSNRELFEVADGLNQAVYRRNSEKREAAKQARNSASGSLPAASLSGQKQRRVFAPEEFSSHLGRNVLSLVKDETLKDYNRGGYAKAMKPKPVTKRVVKRVKPVVKRVKPVVKRM